MKIDCEVIAVAGNGETLEIKMQGSVKGSASWRMMGVFKIDIPENPKSQRAFHLGRRVTLTVEPK